MFLDSHTRLVLWLFINLQQHCKIDTHSQYSHQIKKTEHINKKRQYTNRYIKKVYIFLYAVYIRRIWFKIFYQKNSIHIKPRKLFWDPRFKYVIQNTRFKLRDSISKLITRIMDLKHISYRHETVLHKDHSCMLLPTNKWLNSSHIVIIRV